MVLLAILDLTVGVANDAVNFVNSAVGSNAAKLRTIMIVAACGVLLGVSMSSGMMEVARKGVFNPEFFTMPELLIIFVALMYQDVLLLDLYNTFGLPTSTTVSMVFGLFGGAVGLSLIKIYSTGSELASLANYINTKSLVTIVVAIFMSIVVAFVFGSIIQFLTRVIFTFDFRERFRKYGAVWSAAAISILSIFILMKGMSGAVFIPSNISLWIKDNLLLLSGIIFVALSIILQIITSFFKINLLKIIVLIGTFALAMAFAANDLVNFIGAPVAGLQAFFFASNSPNPNSISMQFLNERVQSQTWMLIIAGAVMVATLFFSRKAKNVIKTEVSLGRQDEGLERFESNMLGRFIIRIVVQTFDFIKNMVPDNTKSWLNKRFDITKYKPVLDSQGNPPSFDLLRAAVNLIVSAGLISLGTSFKLPLSTTYITFIVAMSTALPDKAWGRESAVYRISGVITVVGGWFLTAFFSFVAAFIVAIAIYYGSWFALVGLTGLVIWAFIRTGKFSSRKEKEEIESTQKIRATFKNTSDVSNMVFNEISGILKNISSALDKTYTGLIELNLASLKKARKTAKSNDFQTYLFLRNMLKSIQTLSNIGITFDFDLMKYFYGIQDMADRLNILTNQNFEYYDNVQNELSDHQKQELKSFLDDYLTFINLAANIIAEKSFHLTYQCEEKGAHLKREIERAAQLQIKRTRGSKGNLKRAMLYFSILTDMDFYIDRILNILINMHSFLEKTMDEYKYN